MGKTIGAVALTNEFREAAASFFCNTLKETAGFG